MSANLVSLSPLEFVSISCFSGYVIFSYFTYLETFDCMLAIVDVVLLSIGFCHIPLETFEFWFWQASNLLLDQLHIFEAYF